MRLTLNRPFQSISDDIASEDENLPTLVVIFGPNGAGKTHLLQGLSEGALQLSEPGVETPLTVTYVPINGLIPTPSGRDYSSEYSEGTNGPRDEEVKRFRKFVRSGWAERVRTDAPPPAESIGEYGHDFTERQPMPMTKELILELESKAGRPLEEWTDAEIELFAPLETTRPRGLFESADAIFLRYDREHMDNQERCVRHKLYPADNPVDGLTEEKFLEIHGQPPWETLTAALKAAHLPYSFERSTPRDPERASPSPSNLVDTKRHLRVSEGALSTGERTLLALAISLYSVEHRTERPLKLPDVLLLDEPDAYLHPAITKFMIEMISRIFVEQLGVRVVITTHSPTTVALAPRESLYVMGRDSSPRLQPALSVDDAIAALLVGVPTISMSADHRRVTIVESSNDADYYFAIVQLLGARLASQPSLQFVGAGKNLRPNGTNRVAENRPNGSAAVLELVQKFREAGNLAVWGIVDRDHRTSSVDHIFFDDSRYSIENLLLDPLPLALFLLQQNIITTVEASIITVRAFHQVDTAGDGQSLVNFVTGKVQNDDDDVAPVAVEYIGGFSLDVPAFWLDTRGHDLEDRILDAFPKLKRYNSKRHDLKLDVLHTLKGLEENLPKSVLTLMTQVQS